jgi:hypothetical protein
MDPVALQTITSPVILFFLLGLLAAFMRSELAIPEAVAKALSLYLMIAIGLKGGVAMAKSGIDGEVAIALATGIAASFLIPVIAYALLRVVGRLDQTNSSAVAAHYGSVSVVTFVTASQVFEDTGLAVAGYMVAVLAVMETPAILSGLFLSRRGKTATAEGETASFMHEVFLNASVVLLLGSFVVGWISGPSGFKEVSPLFESGFKGALCIFLLDMGLIAARRLMASRRINLRLAALAIIFPLLNGTIGAVLGTAIGLDPGSAAAFAVLCASASYIAVPAAMRLALPEADPGIYLTMSLSITFPFNILFGIGLFSMLTQLLAGG